MGCYAMPHRAADLGEEFEALAAVRLCKSAEFVIGSPATRSSTTYGRPAEVSSASTTLAMNDRSISARACSSCFEASSHGAGVHPELDDLERDPAHNGLGRFRSPEGTEPFSPIAREPERADSDVRTLAAAVARSHQTRWLYLALGFDGRLADHGLVVRGLLIRLGPRLEEVAHATADDHKIACVSRDECW